jgi:hypothetical protein
MSSWPSAAAFREAIQNPRTCFLDPELQEAVPVADKRGLPIVYSGNFASVFKLNVLGRTRALRCFLADVRDRERRYQAIDEQLDRVAPASLTKFDYVPKGIRVQGRIYPVLLMDWVTGPTLDQYILSDAGTPPTFRALAQAWRETIAELERTSIAHGDLQHGNIIVSSGALKLVDYDGLFVPSLRGMPSMELGHAAYQHPGRSPHDFDEKLDRFSSLSIHLSLTALAEAPRLRDKCTNEHLLFTRADYLAPDTSDMFRQLRQIPSVVGQVTALQAACRRSLAECPSLLSIAPADGPASRLPQWMTDSPNIPEPTSVPIQPPRIVGGSGLPGILAPRANSSGLATAPPSSFMAAGQSSSIAGKRRGLSGAIVWNGFGCGVALLVALAVLGFSINIAAVLGGILAVWIVVSGARERPRVTGRSTQPSTLPPPSRRSAIKYPQTWTSSYTGPVVASVIRTVFHRPNCDWAQKMSVRNRRPFPNAIAARAAGYRPCKVCRP